MIVRYPAYRRYTAARIEVNDAMMALLISARLGAHALESSAAAPNALLPTIFGRINGIERLNRTAQDAARLLAESEKHLAYMAIPYALAVHADFLATSVKMLREAGLDDSSAGLSPAYEPELAGISLDIAHEYIAARCVLDADTSLLRLFHVARKVRNRIIHANGVAGSHLLSDYRHLPEETRAGWERLAGRSLGDAIRDGRLELGEGELVAVLAVSHHCTREMNTLLSRSLPTDYWARVAVADYRESHPQRYGELARRTRRLRGFADSFYAPLRLSDDALMDACTAES